MEGHWKFLGGGGLKVKILEAKYEAKLEFPRGRGVQNKKPSMGGVWIFSGTALFCLVFANLYSRNQCVFSPSVL